MTKHSNFQKKLKISLYEVLLTLNMKSNIMTLKIIPLYGLVQTDRYDRSHQ